MAWENTVSMDTVTALPAWRGEGSVTLKCRPSLHSRGHVVYTMKKNGCQSTAHEQFAHLSFTRRSSVTSSFFPSACPEMNARCFAKDGSTANTNSLAAAPEFLRTMLVVYFATCVVRSTFRVTCSFTRSACTDAERRTSWQRRNKRMAMFWTTTEYVR